MRLSAIRNGMNVEVVRSGRPCDALYRDTAFGLACTVTNVNFGHIRDANFRPLQAVEVLPIEPDKYGSFCYHAFPPCMLKRAKGVAS